MSESSKGRKITYRQLELSFCAMEKFLPVWQQLEAKGRVDGAIGAQYQRVYAAWLKAGEPEDVLAFIEKHSLDKP